MKKVVLVFLLLLILLSSFAQEFGGNPPWIKWKQVNNDTARVIFPKGLDSAAARIANIAHVLGSYTLPTIGNRHRKVNILLQNGTTVSNAYVALGPFRSEFGLIPPQNSFELGSLPWADNLVIHEWRHVQQYSNFNRGVSKVFYILFGQEGQALANALSVPDWFFEGDAVYQETLVSRQGRGRLPFFFNGYRSLWEEEKNYSWMKLRNGSLRDYTPDHYRLGYMLVAYGREKYGADFWKKVTQDAASFKGLFYSLQKGVRKYSGVTYRQFTDEAMHFFKAQLLSGQKISAAETNNHKNFQERRSIHFIGNQEYPYWVDSSTLILMKTTYEQIPHFVIRKNGVDRKIRTRDISIDNYFSYRNNRIVYAAFQPDIRWGLRDYSDLKLLDIATGQQLSLTHRARYFAPDISESGDSIIAVHVDEKGRSQLHLLNRNGVCIAEVPNSDQLFYTYPKFYGFNKVLSAVRDGKGRMSLALTDLTTGKNEYLLDFTYDVIGFPWVDGHDIYFSASSGGLDKLYVLHEKQVMEIQDRQQFPFSTGNYQLNVRNGRMAWTKFTAGGYRLQMASKSEMKLEEATSFPSGPTDFNITSLSGVSNNLLDKIPGGQFPVNDYPKASHLLNFHSRRPYLNDPDYTFSIVSDNILRTLEAEIFGSYNRNEGYRQFGFSAAYAQWFPVIRLSTDYTFDRNAKFTNKPNKVYWDEWGSQIGFYVPLNLTRGREYTFLTAGSDFVYNKVYYKGYYKDSLKNVGFGYLNNYLTFSHQVQQARKQINPRFAQTLLINYKTAVTNVQGHQLLASASLYLPGAFINHSLVLQGAIQGRDTNRVINFSNSFPFARGYSVFSFYRMWRLGANYHLPLLYPDWGFGNLLYFLRIRANMFYDFAQIQEYNRARQLVKLDFRSLGTEIYFDTKWWNQLPVSIGIRYSRLLDQDLEGRSPNQWELVLPVNLLGRY